MHDNQRHTQQNDQNLDQLLSDYYGSELPDMPLSELSWLELQQRITAFPRYAPRRNARWRLPRINRLFGVYLPYRPGSPVPFFMREEYRHICALAHMRNAPHRLRYVRQPHLDIPYVRTTGVLFPSITLVLCREVLYYSSELTVISLLLATGLARCQLAKRLPFIVRFCLCLLPGCVGLLAFVLGCLLHIVLPGALLAILFLLVSRIVLGWHKRQLAYQADELAVRWMGRSAICHGLHLLEDEHLHTSSTRWGEPDLHERIRRVCGTAVKVRPERLTLVR